jgi:hypothetical protein
MTDDGFGRARELIIHGNGEANSTPGVPPRVTALNDGDVVGRVGNGTINPASTLASSTGAEDEDLLDPVDFDESLLNSLGPEDLDGNLLMSLGLEPEIYSIRFAEFQRVWGNLTNISCTHRILVQK